MQVLLRLSIAINFTKMKEDNISQLGDYDVSLCEQQYTHGYYYIAFLKFKSFDQFNTPQTSSNFRHLLSCGTIVSHSPQANQSGKTECQDVSCPTSLKAVKLDQLNFHRLFLQSVISRQWPCRL